MIVENNGNALQSPEQQTRLARLFLLYKYTILIVIPIPRAQADFYETVLQPWRIGLSSFELLTMSGHGTQSHSVQKGQPKSIIGAEILQVALPFLPIASLPGITILPWPFIVLFRFRLPVKPVHRLSKQYVLSPSLHATFTALDRRR